MGRKLDDAMINVGVAIYAVKRAEEEECKGTTCAWEYHERDIRTGTREGGG